MILTKAVFSKYSKLYDVNVKLDTVTIIIGQNDSGKSTLLDGIFNAAAGGISVSKSLSKVLDADAVIRIFFEVGENDLNSILANLGLQASNNDKLLVHRQFELECIYPRHAEQTSREVKVHPQFRAKYNNDKRLNMILKGLLWLLGKRVMLIKPNLELNPEFLRPKRYNIKEKEKYPLNYLFYSTRRRNELNKILNRLLGKMRLEFSRERDNDRITTKVIQTHNEEDIEFSLDEMGDGSRKTISMIMKMYVSDCEVFLLDEPDSSMHSKLVKNLINYLKNLGKQVIISTHNEIFINEFEEENLRYIFSRSPVYSRIHGSKIQKNRVSLESFQILT
jgi:AAA15 family ATPase/GTPase